ncbi:MAG TPA: ABC transporter substrate-binding protein [Vicinamibacterales bacterium]|nr:ABC transporter substrate-binding protein [Vicinamibacterales bacterium]
MARHLTAALVALSVTAAAACNRSPAPPAPAAAGPVRGGSITASIRSEPATFNRFAPNGNQAAVDAVTRLVHAPLVRLNRVTGDVEPWLAERWTTSADGRTITLTLRDGLTFSDGVPLTADDVVFTFEAMYHPSTASSLASGVTVQHKPLQVTASDPRTVIVTLPAPFAPGAALLDNVPILPKHLLQASLDARAFGRAWGTTTPPASMAGLGPFVITEYVTRQRITFARNPHYWRKDASGAALPYLDRIVMQFVPGQDAEMLRVQAGEVDVMAVADVRPEDIASLRRLRDQGTIQLLDVGLSVDPNALWFNLTPGNRAVKAKPYLARAEFRRAISYAVDRDAIVKTVFLGAAEPVHGPITAGNKTWYSPSAPAFPHDPARARTLLASIGLTDRNRDGMLDDARGAPVRFSIITQGGHIRERTATMIQEQLRQAGIAVDIVALDPQSIFGRFGAGDYESIYYGFQASALDPAMNLDMWMSGGSGHVWNVGAPEPWEKTLDGVMLRQSAAPTLAERQQLLLEAQKIFAEHLPQIYFVAPKVTVALSRRVGGAVPVLLDPKVLWNAESLFVKP